MKSPRTFVNYTYDSDDHREAVWQLVCDLRASGVDARSDHDVDAPPEGWPRWMSQQIKDAEFVLSVCTRNNAKRIEGREKPGKGRGATFEGQLLTQHIYDNDTRNSKFIPILFKGSGPAAIPEILKPYTHYKLPNDREKLLRRLTGQPALVTPPLGVLPVLPSREDRGKPVGGAQMLNKEPGVRSSGRVASRNGRTTNPANSLPDDQEELALKLEELLEEYDKAVEDGFDFDWDPIEQWFTTWRGWLQDKLPGKSLRIRALVAQRPPDPDFVKVRGKDVPISLDFGRLAANLRCEVVALLKEHGPAKRRRRG